MRNFFNKKVKPFSAVVEKKKGKGFNYNGVDYVHHTDLTAHSSAFTRFNITQKILLLASLFLFTILLLINWQTTLLVCVSIITIIYFCDLLFNLFLVYKSYFNEPEVKITNSELKNSGHYKWPTYTILCPLYKESEVLPQFVKAVQELDYPKNKLQAMLVLEENDKETIAVARKMKLPKYFTITIVPHSLPKTKPKALNYALDHAKGEYVVIYDAEDIPEKDQLKKAILAFGKVDKSVICIQAKLNFYNSSQNILTRLFTLEYSLWFDLVLTGLQSISAPIPLGGTSNHFRKSDLIKLKRWDPFNVTEDADLGIRLAKLGYNTAIINSYTMEEANSHTINWFKQRSRWIKGYIQTYFVHLRDINSFSQNKKQLHFLTFQLVIGGKILSMVINPILWVMTITYFGFYSLSASFIDALYITPTFYMAAISLFIGNFLYMYYYVLGAAKREQWQLVSFAFLTPIYWLGMSCAAIYAVWEFIFDPHYWHKTKHGLHLNLKINEKPRIRLATTNAI